MSRPLVLVCLLAVLLACAFAETQQALDIHAQLRHNSRAVEADIAFNYLRNDNALGPLVWPSLAPQCGGLNQSPIDISEAIVDPSLTSIIATNYFPLVGATCVKDGRGFICTNPKATTIDKRNLISGGPLNGNYKLLNIQFHYLSEHTIRGQNAHLEVQFVHVSQNFTDAKHPYNMAVISVLFKEGGETTEHPFIKQLMNAAASTQSTVNVSKVEFFNNSAYTDSDVYYTYQGSLTVPSCSETVTWIVMDQIQLVSGAQLKRFFNALPVGGSNRPTQALNGRVVRTNSQNARAAKALLPKQTVGPTTEISINFASLLANVSP